MITVHAYEQIAQAFCAFVWLWVLWALPYAYPLIAAKNWRARECHQQDKA